jgi:hypothetical protein
MARETIAEVRKSRDDYHRSARIWKDKARTAEGSVVGLSEDLAKAENSAKWFRNASAGLALTSLLAIIAVFYRPMTVQVEIPGVSPAPMGMTVVGQPEQSTFESTTEWKKAQTAGTVSPRRVLASVRIGRGGGCSGTIIRHSEDAAWGISAAHCASRVGDQFTIGNPDGTEAAARWIAIDREVDLSLFITWSKDVRAAATVCGDAVPDWSKPIEAIGYPGGSGPKWKRFQYTRTEGHGEAGSRRYFRGRYLFRNLGPGSFAGGDSGGGVFYDGDHLIGVMTHGGPHAAGLPQIQKFLADNGKLFKGVEPFT